MKRIDQAKEELKRLQGKSKLESMLGVASIFTELTEEQQGIHPIVVGGLAVEIYTKEAYATWDIDMVFSNYPLANELLLALGFHKEGRHWYHEGLSVSVEIPGDQLEEADYNRVLKLNLSNGRHVYMIGVEDIILDRLRACKHWKSTSDCEWGLRLFQTHRERLDIPYLQQQSKADLTEDILQSWLSEPII
ncbi:hypothetical protein LSG31_19040 [Fodinisporobacter ferrooxydans]|uniref:DUF6036 domain-containing protein n=1 Tax=Fodinisporobacter ferrooxydans TaxID=2901836 RepID=A0ABY4CI20_9BACL|nr:hypothetical protein LSG31_19040 [Alicyclobacillaceae bacterium MYW30-H2]